MTWSIVSRPTSSVAVASTLRPYGPFVLLNPQGLSQRQQLRHSSHGPARPPSNTSSKTTPGKPLTIQTLHQLHASHTPITMLTAHNYPSALLAEAAGIDIILVGDSLAMVSLGMPDTSEVTLDEMIMHARAVSRAASSSFTVADLPMGSYEISPEQALASAIRMMKEGRMKSVKLEGGAEVAETVKKIATAGIPIMGHVGLTPQRQHALGGFRVQGNTVSKAVRLLEDARAVAEAGAFAVVLEAVPPEIAEVVTSELSVPTIGIGAGAGTSGQVLVQMDMLGTRPAGCFMPKFVKLFGSEWESSLVAIERYKQEVVGRTYPAAEHNYKSNPEVAAALKEVIARGKR